MNQADLKIGMYLKNDGKGFIPVYGNKDTTGQPFLLIHPGEMIGQIFDFGNGKDGFTIYFGSDVIQSKANLIERVMDYLLSWEPDFIRPRAAGVVKFSDLTADVSDAQVLMQKQAMDTAEQNGVSLSNGIKKVAKATGEIISEAGQGLIPWTLVGVAAAGYVVINWNKFFKPATLRK